MEDLSARVKDYAIYTPSMQIHSARRIEGSRALRDGKLPKKLQADDLNFLDPNNKYWHYKWVLASAGTFKNERSYNAITCKSPQTFVLGDSGGFQIGTGALDEIKAWNRYAKDPQKIMGLWRSEKELKKQIVDWLDLHCNYAMTIDIPLWIVGRNQSPFRNCSKLDIINLSVENLQFIQRNRGDWGNCKYLNVLQGDTEQDEEDWFNGVKCYNFEGWSLAGGVGQAGGIYRVLRRILLLRDQKCLDRGFDWLHILRLSIIRWAPLVTAMQRALRNGTNEGLTISFDSSSPYQMGGVRVDYAVLNTFGKSLDSDWSIKAASFPVGYGFANSSKKMHLSKSYKGYLDHPMDSPIAKLLTVQDMNVKKRETDIRTIDAFADEVILNHNVYVFCLAHILANEHVFCAQPTAPQEMMDAVGIVEELFRVEDWHSYLDLKRNVLARPCGRI